MMEESTPHHLTLKERLRTDCSIKIVFKYLVCMGCVLIVLFLGHLAFHGGKYYFFDSKLLALHEVALNSVNDGICDNPTRYGKEAECPDYKMWAKLSFKMMAVNKALICTSEHWGEFWVMVGNTIGFPFWLVYAAFAWVASYLFADWIRFILQLLSSQLTTYFLWFAPIFMCLLVFAIYKAIDAWKGAGQEKVIRRSKLQTAKLLHDRYVHDTTALNYQDGRSHVEQTVYHGNGRQMPLGQMPPIPIQTQNLDRSIYQDQPPYRPETERSQSVRRRNDSYSRSQTPVQPATAPMYAQQQQQQQQQQRVQNQPQFHTPPPSAFSPHRTSLPSPSHTPAPTYSPSPVAMTSTASNITSSVSSSNRPIPTRTNFDKIDYNVNNNMTTTSTHNQTIEQLSQTISAHLASSTKINGANKKKDQNQVFGTGAGNTYLNSNGRDNYGRTYQ